MAQQTPRSNLWSALFTGWAREYPSFAGDVQSAAKRLREAAPGTLRLRTLDFDANAYRLRAERQNALLLWVELTLRGQGDGQVKLRARLRRTVWLWLYAALALAGIAALADLLLFPRPNTTLAQYILPLWTLVFIMQVVGSANALDQIDTYLEASAAAPAVTLPEAPADAP